ncbi:hypothetical protein GGP41_010309 [Bipolaris sorokiniana]|uniref:Uncharacterized protein n=1 Tax=Cochliobolus sativus TaxID=45130 RepID=A0A8H6DWM6_COCSA|nr:hypothetical protein GGP41_010309 [Bipolaris sorokiniana]
MDRHDSGKPGCDSEHVLDKTVSNAAKADFEGACASPAANRPYGHNEVIDEEPEVQKQAGQGCEKEQAKCSSPASLSTVSASLSTVSASSESQKQGVSETETSNARVVTYATETACGCVTLRNFSEFALHIKNLRCRLWSGKMDKTAEPANFDRNPKHSHHGKAHSTMQGPPDHYPGPGDPPSASPVYNLHETMPSGSGASVPPQPFTNPPLGPVMGYFPCPPSSTGAPGTSVPRLPLPCINPSSVNPPGPVIGSFPCPPRSTGAPGTSQSFINSPPGPVIRTFSCPPNSNTRLATRGRGGSGSSSPSTRGGSSQAPYFTPSSRCRGTASPGHFSGGLPNLVLPESMHGGRGRGTSEQGSRGGRGDGAPGN